MICSRRTSVILSTRPCICRKSGTEIATSVPITPAMSGTMTTKVSESVAFSRIAMMTPPIARIGAVRRMVSAIWRKSCTCWTSFVLRVINDGVPKRVISRAEKCWTRSKTAPRTSRPTPIDARDAKYTLMIARTPRTSVTASITAPVRQM